MSASLLPNGKQQFIDINGKPLVGGTVGMYVPNTLVPKSTWQDSGQTILNTNPITLDSRGEAIIYGNGTYRQIVKDSLGNLIWDQLTAPTSIGTDTPAQDLVWQAQTLPKAFNAFAQADVPAATMRTGLTLNEHEAATELNFSDYYDQSSFADCTTSLQNFLLYCQRVAFWLKSTGLDDILQTCNVTATLPRGLYYVSCPIIVPSLVNLNCEGSIVGQSNHLNSGTDTYTGDTTSQALNNQYQPTLILTPTSGGSRIHLYCNPDGNTAHQTNGMVCGKNWTASSITQQSGGSGYHIGDVLTGAIPSKGPYGGFRLTVNTVDGGGAITSFTTNYDGCYDLPSALQAIQWTTTNGFVDVNTGGPIFTSNGSGVFYAYGGHGTGATFTITWASDFASTNYTGGQTVIGDCVLGTVRVYLPFNSFDPIKYGETFAIMWWGLNHTFENIATVGGRVGALFLSAADVHGDHLNPVNPDIGIQLFGSGGIQCTNAVIDTPTGAFLVADQCANVKIKGLAFGTSPNPGGGPSASGYGVMLGSAAAGTNCALDIELLLQQAGSSTPAAYLAYTRDSHIDLQCSNGTTGSATPGTNQITSFADIGPGWEASNKITGQIDNVAGALFASVTAPGTPGGANSPPVGAVNIWDKSANGYAGVTGTYQIWGAGAPTNGVTGANKAGKQSVYNDTSNADMYFNTGTPAGTTWAKVTHA